MIFSRVCCGPRRLDPDLAARIKPGTLESYRKHLVPLVHWLDSKSWEPVGFEEWDDCLVEYKNSRKLTRSQFDTTRAALEFFFPRFRKKLQYSMAVGDGITKQAVIRHKHPMIKSVSFLLGAQLASMGKPRQGCAIIISRAAGLRPSETVSLCPEHVMFASTNQNHSATLRLGAIVGTKAQREQTATVFQVEEPQAYEILARLVAVTPIGTRMFPFAYAQYNRSLQQAEQSLGLNIGYTPHGARAGFASERVAAGESPVEVQRKGRWKNQTSFEVYVDIVGAAQIATNLQLQGFSDKIAYCNVHVLDFFPLYYLAAQVNGASIISHSRITGQADRLSQQGGNTRQASELSEPGQVRRQERPAAHETGQEDRTSAPGSIGKRSSGPTFLPPKRGIISRGNRDIVSRTGTAAPSATTPSPKSRILPPKQRRE